MAKIEFFITRAGRGFQLLDGNDLPHLDEVFPSREAAADMAVRFAQESASLYAIYA